MLTKRSLVFKFSARAGTDLEFKQNLLFEFWQKCKLRLIMRKTNRQNSWLAQNKILIGVRIHSASQGQTLNLITKVCPSFFAQFFFFRQWGVKSAGFYLHSAPRLEQAREAWVAGSYMHRKTGTDLEFKQNKHWVFYSCSKQASDRATASCERRLGNQNFAEISCLFLFGFCIISGEREESYAMNGKKYTGSTGFVKSVSTC